MINKVILIGNVGKKPEIRETPEGKKVASFSLATSESWKDKSSGEKKTKSEWHKVAIFSEGLAKFVEGYVNKGDKLYIEGSVRTRKWTDKKGVEQSITEVVLQGYGADLKLLSTKKGE